MKDLNRIKVVLAERKRTNKWLAAELDKDPATVSKWCTNSSQPDLATLRRVAVALGVDIRDLLVPTPQKTLEAWVIIDWYSQINQNATMQKLFKS